MGHVAAIMFLLIIAHLLAARMPETIKRQQLPTLMSVAKNHVIALDAAVASGVVGERAFRLLQNGQHIALDQLPYLLITTHDDPKIERMRCNALIQRLGSCL